MKTAQIKRLVRKLRVNPSARMHDRTLCDALDAQAESQKTKSAEMHRGVVSTIMTNRAARLAAAGVVILLIGFAVVRQAAHRQSDGQALIEAAKSPAEMLTYASLTVAYRQGGFEEVDKQCEKAFELLGPRPESLSPQQVLAEFNGS
jgi:hypothetical protein